MRLPKFWKLRKSVCRHSLDKPEQMFYVCCMPRPLPSAASRIIPYSLFYIPATCHFDNRTRNNADERGLSEKECFLYPATLGKSGKGIVPSLFRGSIPLPRTLHLPSPNPQDLGRGQGPAPRHGRGVRSSVVPRNEYHTRRVSRTRGVVPPTQTGRTCHSVVQA